MKRFLVVATLSVVCAAFMYSANAQDVGEVRTPETFTVWVKNDDGDSHNLEGTTAAEDTTMAYRPWAYNSLQFIPYSTVADSLGWIIIEAALDSLGNGRGLVFAPIDSLEIAGATTISNPPTTFYPPTADWVRFILRPVDAPFTGVSGGLLYNRGVTFERIR